VRPGCDPLGAAFLGHIALEGLAGSVLNEGGLNDRIRSVAVRYGARVVDPYVPFWVNASTLISSDCVHPSGAGHQALAMLSGTAFLEAQ
jgi:hypothetical protein